MPRHRDLVEIVVGSHTLGIDWDMVDGVIEAMDKLRADNAELRAEVERLRVAPGLVKDECVQCRFNNCHTHMCDGPVRLVSAMLD